jgi:hypothetical protein
METRELTPTAVHVSPGEGKTFSVLRCDLITFKVVGEDTRGHSRSWRCRPRRKLVPYPTYITRGRVDLCAGGRVRAAG